MRSWDLKTSDEGWRLPSEHRGVSRCVVDHAFAMEFHEGEHSVVVRIEGASTVVDQGHVHRLTSATPKDLGPAVGLFGQVVRSATASAQGSSRSRLSHLRPDGAWRENCADGSLRAMSHAETLSRLTQEGGAT
jgi:hypothetical protein